MAVVRLTTKKFAVQLSKTVDTLQAFRPEKGTSQAMYIFTDSTLERVEITYFLKLEILKASYLNTISFLLN